MASYNELNFDWSMLCKECTKWTKSDLQLAAELGKTLLERNKELESSLKQHQNVIEDQAQEIEYLTKQTVALREVNDSRLRIYEQLEVSIQDLERANHRLAVENATEKKHIKTLCHSIETLEAKNDDLNKHLEETKQLLDIERRKNDRIIQENNRNKNNSEQQQKIFKLKPVTTTLSYDECNFSEPETEEARVFNSTENCSYAFKSPTKLNNKGRNNNIFKTVSPDVVDGLPSTSDSYEDNDVIIKLMTDLEMTKKHCLGEEQKVSELEEQLVTLIQENQTLQGRIAQINTNEEMKSVHEELSILEEVRQGQMCNRCLRSIEDKASQAEDSSMLGIEEEDDRSLIEMLNNAEDQRIFRSAVQIKDAQKHELHEMQPSPNPYRELVEKYEALLEVQRHSLMRNRQNQITTLNDEFQTSGEFSSINTKDTDEESAHGVHKNGTGARRKVNLRTPTDFSEAETSSSGFSDETSNKATQTDERSGYFLCTIADGDDCKFSIYDDASPIDSRFRNRPEYRELFKEIFAILKKAAENKDEGEKLPLLDDVVPVKAPPVTPATEELPEFIDDNQSIISSAVSEQSVAMSERITKTERKRIEGKKHTEKNGQENKPPTGQQIDENGKVLTPLKRLPLEYLSVSVNIRKKSKKNRRNINLDRSDSPILPSPPRVYYTSSGKKRRDMKPLNLQTAENRAKFEWNGNSMTIYNRNIQSPTPSTNQNSLITTNNGYDSGNVEFKPSAASQDLHKLKKLDLSYAEVLRRADQNNHHQRRK